jgi:hypothetical protein
MILRLTSLVIRKITSKIRYKMPAISQSQQKLMGQAYALKNGDLKPEDLNPEYRKQIEDLADGMTFKQLKIMQKPR